MIPGPKQDDKAARQFVCDTYLAQNPDPDRMCYSHFTCGTGQNQSHHLEDLVSPCLGLLEDQNNKKIIENVKKFINNLHYS